MELLRDARRRADDGLRLCEQQDYQGALGKFAHVFVYLDALPRKADSHLIKCIMGSIDEEDEAELTTLRNSVLLNQAFCLLKLHKPARALIKCDQALELLRSSKGLYRRVKALLALGRLQEAEDDALEGVNRGESDFTSLLSKIRRKRCEDGGEVVVDK